MSYETRRELYSQIEQARGNPLVVYVTSLRQGASGQIAPDVIAEFISQIRNIPSSNAVDLLVVSNGGDPIVAWRLVNLLREKFARLNVLLPYTAYSAATLLALGADSIVMHPFASLGPVDPQLTSLRQNEDGLPESKQFGSEDLMHFLSFVRENVGVTDQRQLQESFELLCRDVGALGIGRAKRSSQLMLSLGSKLLSLHMEDKNEARTIAESLNKAYYHHGYSVGRREAIELRLAVESPSADVEQLIWQAWEALADEMECDTPFDPLAIVYGNPDAARSLDLVNHMTVPSNLPAPIMNQVVQHILQQPVVHPVIPVAFEIVHAAIESVRGYSQFRQVGDIRALRMPDMNIRYNVTSKSQKWTYTPYVEPGENDT